MQQRSSMYWSVRCDLWWLTCIFYFLMEKKTTKSKDVEHWVFECNPRFMSLAAPCSERFHLRYISADSGSEPVCHSCQKMATSTSTSSKKERNVAGREKSAAGSTGRKIPGLDRKQQAWESPRERWESELCVDPAAPHRNTEHQWVSGR